MRDLSVLVENLRLVQRARRRFMELWSVEKDYINPMLDRMAEDLQRVETPEGNYRPAGVNKPGVSDEER